jgi:hypothetical protein
LIDEYKNFASKDRELKTRLNRFNEYLTHLSIKKEDSIFALIRTDPFIFESYEPEHKNGIKNIKNIFKKEFINHLRSKNIETLPLLPIQFLPNPDNYNASIQKFHITARIEEAYAKFWNAMERDLIPQTELKCILLVCFYHFELKHLNKLCCNDIHDNYSKHDYFKDHRVFILRNDYPIPITRVVGNIFKCDKEPEDKIVNVTDNYLARGFQKYVKEEFGFKDWKELQLMIFQSLVSEVGFNLAHAFTAKSTPALTKRRFETNIEGKRWIGYLRNYYPLSNEFQIDL